MWLVPRGDVEDSKPTELTGTLITDMTPGSLRLGVPASAQSTTQRPEAEGRKWTGEGRKAQPQTAVGGGGPLSGPLGAAPRRAAGAHSPWAEAWMQPALETIRGRGRGLALPAPARGLAREHSLCPLG